MAKARQLTKAGSYYITMHRKKRSVKELAEDLGVHPLTVRAHLDRLGQTAKGDDEPPRRKPRAA